MVLHLLEIFVLLNMVYSKHFYEGLVKNRNFPHREVTLKQTSDEITGCGLKLMVSAAWMYYDDDKEFI